jgi:hypothetical protein
MAKELNSTDLDNSIDFLWDRGDQICTLHSAENTLRKQEAELPDSRAFYGIAGKTGIVMSRNPDIINFANLLVKRCSVRFS